MNFYSTIYSIENYVIQTIWNFTGHDNGQIDSWKQLHCFELLKIVLKKIRPNSLTLDISFDSFFLFLSHSKTKIQLYVNLYCRDNKSNIYKPFNAINVHRDSLLNLALNLFSLFIFIERNNSWIYIF